MKNITNTETGKSNNNEYLKADNTGELISDIRPNFSPDNFSLTPEGGKNFFRYLKRQNLFNDRGLLILSPNNHYFYDESELQGVQTVLNLKRLNLVNDLDTFLYSVYQILAPEVNFIGCFTEYETVKWYRFLSGLSYKINNLLDLKTDTYLSRKDITHLLAKNGFKVIDMTTMNGLTFFYSKKVSKLTA